MIDKFMNFVLKILEVIFGPIVPIISPVWVRLLIFVGVGAYVLSKIYYEDEEKAGQIDLEDPVVSEALPMLALPYIAMFLMGLYVEASGDLDGFTAFEPIVRRADGINYITFSNYVHWSDNPRYTSLLAAISVPVTAAYYTLIKPKKGLKFVLGIMFAFLAGTLYADLQIGVSIIGYNLSLLSILWVFAHTVWKMFDGLLASLFLFVAVLAWILPTGKFNYLMAVMGHMARPSGKSSSDSVDIDSLAPERSRVPNYGVDSDGVNYVITGYEGDTEIGIRHPDGNEVYFNASSIQGQSYVMVNGKRVDLIW